MHPTSSRASESESRPTRLILLPQLLRWLGAGGCRKVPPLLYKLHSAQLSHMRWADSELDFNRC